MMSIGFFFCTQTTHTADASAGSKHLHFQDIPEWQSACMHRAIDSNTLVLSTKKATDAFWEFLCPKRPQSYDPCTWNCIQCENNVMKKLHFTTREPSTQGMIRKAIGEWKVDADWLPSTLEEIHFYYIHLVHGWLSERLPRALHYLCFHDCRLSSKHTDRSVDLRKLPTKLETLIIEGGWLQGLVVLDNLPEVMRICIIRHNDMHRAYVNSLHIPKDLELIALRAFSHLVEVEELSEGELDDRVRWSQTYWKFLPETYLAYEQNKEQW